MFTAPAAGFVPLGWKSFDATSLLYPPLYSYLAGATTAAAHLLGLQPAPGMFAPATVFTTRLPSALIGLATVWLVGRLAARMYAGLRLDAGRIGVTAAALLAVAPLHVMHSHIAAADILLTFAVALTMTAAWALIDRPSALRALLAGMAAGVAFGAKQNGLAMAVPVAWACGEVAVARHRPSLFLTFGAVALLGLVVAWAICCPPCLLHFDSFCAEIATHGEKLSRSQGVSNHLVPALGWLGYPFAYQLGASLPYALGWPLYLLCVYGIASAVRRHEQADRLLLATLLPYFVVIASATVTFPRYLLPLFSGLTIAAARALWPPGTRFAGARAAVLVAVLAYSLILTITQVARFSSEQRREVAAFAVSAVRAARPPFLANAPIRVAVPALVTGMDYFRVASALELAGAKPVAVQRGKWLEEAYDAFVVPHWIPIWLRRDGDAPLALQDLERLESGEVGYYRARRFPSWYLQQSFYTRLDPAFYGDLWQGDIGYDVYLRGAPPR